MTTKITSANITQSGTSGISSVAWQAVQTTGFTAVAGRAYPCNTTSAAFTVTLPASPAAGNVITLTDYAGTWGTNNLTINPNGGKINGGATNGVVSTSRGAVSLVYVDSTQGWISFASNLATTISQTITVDFLVLAGGGGGTSGGGGAGGYRTSVGTSGGSPGTAESALALSLNTAYTITVGAGGKGKNQSPATTLGLIGNNSVFASITSAGGGWGGGQSGVTSGNGGSGGGGGRNNTSKGNGTANQGFDGGVGVSGSGTEPAGGGGGAGGLGGNGVSPGTAGAGGSGRTSPLDSISRGGGGGGTTENASGGTASSGGGPGGNPNGSNATDNYGGGGGGASGSPSSVGGNGGSGIILIRIPSANTATFSGGVTQTSTTGGGYKIYTVTAAGVSDTVTFS